MLSVNPEKMIVSQVFKEFDVFELDPLKVYGSVSGEGTYILESAEGGEKVARYSILGLNPAFSIKVRDGRADVKTANGFLEDLKVSGGNPSTVMKGLLGQMTLKEGIHSRFAGGFVGYISYDFIRYFEDVGSSAKDTLKQPDCEFVLARNNIVFDHVARKIYLTSNVFSRQDEDDAKKDLEELTEKFLDMPLEESGKKPATKTSEDADFSSNVTQHEYEESVRAAIKYIRAGDIFQVVLSQRLEMKKDKKPLDVYATLKQINPSPYMYYLDLGKRQVVGSSPEMLARVEGKKVLTYPIAGTRSRGKTVREDSRLAKEMTESPKERSEHVMLVDLGRNDLGRVSRFGSVKVNKFMNVEKYSHVQHMVSEVEGELEEGRDAFDALNSVFPAGTVSGAPKVRAMEIIEELEPERRGVYAGCVGYFSLNRNMDTAIAIRTLVFEGGRAYAQAGAGIVADSVPEHEYKETLKKAMALVKSL